MMTDNLKCGVIGVGTMGIQYAKIIKQLRDVNLVGVVDINTNTVKKVAKEIGVNPYTDARELYEKEKPDIVVISCPDEFHADYAALALERNINVYLEKPVAHTLEDCYKILKFSKRSSAKINIAYILRILPQYAQIRMNVMEGKFGEIIHFYTRRNGVFNEGLRWKGKNDLATYLVCHDADIIMWITGNKIERVYAEEVIKSLKEFNIHDTIQVVLKLNDGSIGVIECSWAIPNACKFSIDNRLELIGTKAAAFINLQDQGLHNYSEDGISWPDMIFGPEIDGFIVGALRNEFERFVESVLYDKPVMCTVEEGIEATKVAIATKASLEKNQVVYIRDIK